MKVTQFSRNKTLPLAWHRALSATAETDYFLKFDGVNGENFTKGHGKWSDINSFT